MRRSQWDMGFAMLIAAGGCLVLMVVGFRGVRHPMLVLVMLAASITWALGFTTEMIGHLNIFLAGRRLDPVRAGDRVCHHLRLAVFAASPRGMATAAGVDGNDRKNRHGDHHGRRDGRDWPSCARC